MLLRLVVVLACLMPAWLPAAYAQPVITQAQGIAFSANGRQILVPHREGIAVFERGNWLRWPGPKHAYVGFAATKSALYGSGHADPKSGFPNPLGFLRSRDGGMTWERLGFQGEASFPALAAGWSSDVVYVWNAERNWSMRAPGLYSTSDDGRNWIRARGKGLDGETVAVAVHPRDGRNVAVATNQGVFLSRDSGASFRNLAPGTQGEMVFFDLDGRQLWLVSFDGKSKLRRVMIVDGKGDDVPMPAQEGSARFGVAYMAQSPVDRASYAMVIGRRDVHVTKDAGKTWMAIAREGRAILQ